jgi:hypothetical protein
MGTMAIMTMRTVHTTATGNDRYRKERLRLFWITAPAPRALRDTTTAKQNDKRRPCRQGLPFARSGARHRERRKVGLGLSRHSNVGPGGPVPSFKRPRKSRDFDEGRHESILMKTPAD